MSIFLFRGYLYMTGGIWVKNPSNINSETTNALTLGILSLIFPVIIKILSLITFVEFLGYFASLILCVAVLILVSEIMNNSTNETDKSLANSSRICSFGGIFILALLILNKFI